MLAAACCRWPPAPVRDSAVQRAAIGIDWARFARVVRRQRIAGLVAPALKAAGVSVPEEIAAPILQSAHHIVRQNLLATSETVRLVRLISSAGFPVLVVKGVALGAQAYGSISLKHSKDIDLLILPEHIAGVIALLEADQYRLTAPAPQLSAAQTALLPRYGKDASLVHRAQGLHVELHWRLIGNTNLLPRITAGSPTDPVTLAPGVTVPTLNLRDLYAYLVVHGAIDGWSRMKWIADVNALLAPLPMKEIVALHGYAVANGAGVASAQALLLMRDLFGLALPEGFAAALQRSWRVRMLVAGAYRLMAVADGGTEIADWRGGQMRALAMQMLLRYSLRYQWQILKSVLYMQSDMYQSRIPPTLYGLYPAIRIPAWLLGLGKVRQRRHPAA